MASDRNRTLDTLLLLLHSYQHVRPLSQSSCLPRPPLRQIEEESSKFDVALLQLDHLGVARIIINIYQARALRALGLLLADGAPTVGVGKTFGAVSRIFLRKQL